MTNRREHLDERDVGISSTAAAALGPLLDEPEPTFTVHLVLPKSEKTPAYEPFRSACGIVGIEPHTNVGSLTETRVSCEACKAHIAAIHAKKDLSSLTSLKKAPLHRSKLSGDRRDRLVVGGFAEVRGDFVRITEAGIERLAELKQLVKGAA